MTAAPSRPNILFIMTDQQRYDQMGYTSDGFFETPNLDRLARNGVIFDNAYSTSTVCVPARTSLLTGLFPHRAPTQVNGLALQEGFWTIAHALRAAGYQTATIGKGHFYPIHSRHGFERMRMVEHLNCYSPGVVDDYLRWLVWEGKAESRATHLTGGRWGQRIPGYWDNHTAMPFPYEEKYHPTP